MHTRYLLREHFKCCVQQNFICHSQYEHESYKPRWVILKKKQYLFTKKLDHHVHFSTHAVLFPTIPRRLTFCLLPSVQKCSLLSAHGEQVLQRTHRKPLDDRTKIFCFRQNFQNQHSSRQQHVNLCFMSTVSYNLDSSPTLAIEWLPSLHVFRFGSKPQQDSRVGKNISSDAQPF